MVHGVLVAISHLIHQQRKGRSVIRLGVSQLEEAFIHEIKGRFYDRLNSIQLLLLWAFQVLSLLYVDPSLPESQSEVDCHLHRSTGSFSKKFLDTVYWHSLGQHFIFQLSLNFPSTFPPKKYIIQIKTLPHISWLNFMAKVIEVLAMEVN